MTSEGHTASSNWESFQIIAVTNRALCDEPLPVRVANLCAAGFNRIIVREKDLAPLEYSQLLQQILESLPAEFHRHITVNTFASASQEAGISSIQLSFPDALKHAETGELETFGEVGVSIHSVEESLKAEELGAHYLIAGHIFDTTCKPGVPSRGLEFLREVCQATSLPVYAIGGIGPENFELVQTAGAAGACLMSLAMTCPDPRKVITRGGHPENL